MQLSSALICRAGYYRPTAQFTISNFSSPCLPCPLGQAKSLGQWQVADCVECPAGFYANQTASAECLPCPDGSKQPRSGNAFCTQCEVGKFRTSTSSLDQRECIFCNSTQYMPLLGAQLCINCPNNSRTGAPPPLSPSVHPDLRPKSATVVPGQLPLTPSLTTHLRHPAPLYLRPTRCRPLGLDDRHRLHLRDGLLHALRRGGARLLRVPHRRDLRGWPLVPLRGTGLLAGAAAPLLTGLRSM